MAAQAIRVRKKGQMTLPSDVRQDLGLIDDDVVYLTKEDGRYFISTSRDLVDTAKGALAEFATYRNPDPEEERNWVGRHIAETPDDHE